MQSSHGRQPVQRCLSGCSVLKDTSGPAADRLRKEIIKTFERLGSRITIEENWKAVNCMYLDITISLSDGTYRLI